MPRSTPTEVRRRNEPHPHDTAGRHHHDADARTAEHQHFQMVTRMLRQRRSARPPSLSTLTPGTVVWAWLAWRDAGGGTVRPAVVLGARVDRVEVLGLSSVRPRHAVVALPEDEPFLSWPSGCQLHRSWLERTDIVSIAGRLSRLNRATADAVAATLSLQARLPLPGGAR